MNNSERRASDRERQEGSPQAFIPDSQTRYSQVARFAHASAYAVACTRQVRSQPLGERVVSRPSRANEQRGLGLLSSPATATSSQARAGKATDLLGAYGSLYLRRSVGCVRPRLTSRRSWLGWWCEWDGMYEGQKVTEQAKRARGLHVCVRSFGTLFVAALLPRSPARPGKRPLQ